MLFEWQKTRQKWIRKKSYTGVFNSIFLLLLLEFANECPHFQVLIFSKCTYSRSI